jgi:hypothetical protein
VNLQWIQKVSIIEDVTPAEAGVQVRKFWIPVFTGMTPKLEAEAK